MINSNYKKVFTGNIFVIQQIQESLGKLNITPVIKDDSESGRLAGFGAPSPAMQEVFVHENEYDKAITAVEEIVKEL